MRLISSGYSPTLEFGFDMTAAGVLCQVLRSPVQKAIWQVWKVSGEAGESQVRLLQWLMKGSQLVKKMVERKNH